MARRGRRSARSGGRVGEGEDMEEFLDVEHPIVPKANKAPRVILNPPAWLLELYDEREIMPVMDFLGRHAPSWDFGHISPEVLQWLLP